MPGPCYVLLPAAHAGSVPVLSTGTRLQLPETRCVAADFSDFVPHATANTHANSIAQALTRTSRAIHSSRSRAIILSGACELGNAILLGATKCCMSGSAHLEF